MGDFAEGNMVLELRDVVSKWKVLCDGSGGEPRDGFVFDVNVDKQHFEIGLEGCPCSE